jgi:hypothetical protein
MASRPFLVCVAVDAGWLATQPVAGGLRWPALIAVVACQVWCVLDQRAHPTLRRREVLLAAAGLVALAVALPPYGSKDIWSYVMYGRLLGVHHVSPFTNSPGTFPHDPFVHRVLPKFVHTPSVYGPLWNGLSAVGAVVTGTSALLARLFYQAIAGAAFLGALVLLARRGVAVWTLALVGLAPGALSAINGAHIDVLVGFGLVVALLLVADGRYAWAGLAIGATVLIKIVALPAAGGVVLALLLARRLRPAATVGAVSGVLVLVGYLIAGGRDALKPIQHGATYDSKASLVHGVIYVYDAIGRHVPDLLANSDTRTKIATGLAAVTFGLFAWRRRKAPEPATFAVAAMLCYLLTANYVLPWYALAVLPLSALALPRLRWCALATLVLLQLVYVNSNFEHLPFPVVVGHVGPVVELVLLAIVIFRADPSVGWRDGRRPDARRDPGTHQAGAGSAA